MPFENDREDLVEGRNAVIEALRAGRALDKIYIAKGETDKTLGGDGRRRDAEEVSVIWPSTPTEKTASKAATP